MISSVATAAAVERRAQERRRQQELQLLGGEENKEPSRSTSTQQSDLDADDEGEHPPIQQTLDISDGRTQPSADVQHVLASSTDGNGAAADLDAPNRAPETPTTRQSKAQLLIPGAASEPVTVPEPQQQQQQQPGPEPPRGSPGPAAPAAAPLSAPLHPVARLVDIVLQVTNDRFGASVRVQQKLAEEVVQGVAEAADESERGDSVTMSVPQSKRLSGAVTSTSLGDVTPRGAKFTAEVEDVYKFDLMEDNPNWRNFLTSMTGVKAQKWDAKRQAADGRLSRLLYSKPRKWIYMTLSYPDFSRLAYWFGVFMISIIFLNTATFCVESIPHYNDTLVYDSLIIVDYVCMGIFTFEYLARLLCCPDLWRFLRSLSNLIDLVAILPFYIELMVTGTSYESEAFQTRIVRLLRVFRVLRIVKTMPKLRHLTLVSDTLRDSVEVLIMLGFLLLVLLVVFGTVIYLVEPITFDSIPQAMYYAQTTLTTTGYGDVYPVTPWGRFVAGVAMLLCMVVVSLPIAVIGGNFSEKWSDYKSFKVSVDRSSRVYPNATELRGELERYENALDDVIQRLQETEVASEKQLAAVRQQIAAARSVLLAGSAGSGVGEPPGYAAAAGVSTSSRWAAAGKGLLRRARNVSLTAPKAGLSGAAPGTPRDSVTNLVEAADRSGLEAGGPTGSSKRQKELRSVAALVARSATQPAQLPEGGADHGSTSGAGDGSEGPAVGRGSGAIRMAALKFMRETKGENCSMSGVASPYPSRDYPGGAASAAGGATRPLEAGGEPAVVMELTAVEPDAVDALPSSHSLGAVPRVPPAAGSLPRPLPDLTAAAALPPPVPAPPGAPLPPAPPPQLPQPPQPLTLQPSVGGESVGLGTPSLRPVPSVGGAARSITASLASLLGRKSDAAAAAAAAALAAYDESLPREQRHALPVDPDALQNAANQLDHAQACCSRARDMRIRHDALALQAQILRTDDMPYKLEKLDESYRILRCWQDELGPLAERMWCLRDALDELAWALQEGLPEGECKYQPASPEERRQKDAELGVDPRMTSSDFAPGAAAEGDMWESGGAARAGGAGGAYAGGVASGGARAGGSVRGKTAVGSGGAGAAVTVLTTTASVGLEGNGPNGSTALVMSTK